MQELAAAAKRAGHPGLIGQIRGDLFLGLLDGRFHHLTREQMIAALIADYRPDGPGAVTEMPDPAEGPDPADPAETTDPTTPTAPAPSAAPARRRQRRTPESRSTGSGSAELDLG